MSFTEAVRTALASLRANKLRSFLTVLGILIGVGAVIAVVAITRGLDGYMSREVLKLGGKSFTVQKMDAIIGSHERWEEMQRRKDIPLSAVETVRRRCAACLEVGASVDNQAIAKWRDLKQEDVNVRGITDNYNRIGSPRNLTAGRHIVPDDVTNASHVAVIGSDLVDAFFPNIEPLGKTILLGGQPLTVVGVAEKKGSLFGFSQDNIAYVPITTYRKLFSGRDSITIQVEARSMAEFETAQEQCRVAMRALRHLGARRPDDFAIETGETIMEFWKTLTKGIYVTTFVVTVISLIVGGIVVMNIMLVSVTERIREIGVRKALGARRRDIRLQFLVESVILSLLGGALGILGAAAFSWILANVLGSIMKTPFSAPVQAWAVVLALGVSTGVGLVAGIYPAARAAAFDPVVALRYE
jgi:putative ABC transport system permease protein